MNTTQAYLIEIISYTHRFQYFLMDSECEIEMRRNLNVTPSKLRKLFDIGFERGYIAYKNKAFPWKIIPTDEGSRFASLPEEVLS